MRLRALVFDMDGTLADTDPVHVVAFTQLLAKHGIVMDEEFYRDRISGRTNESIFADLFPSLSSDEQRGLADEKEAVFRSMANHVGPLPGLLRVLDWADHRGLGLGLVTNAPPENAEHMLKVLELASRFHVKIVGGDVARGKPDPLPYLTALERLGVTAGEAMAFEDSVSGIKAAKAAGITTFGILTGQTGETLLSVGADAVIQNFDDADFWTLLETRAAG